MRHKVVVVIPNYNGMTTTYEGRPILENCMESLACTEGQPFKTVVVDDGSTDDSARAAKARGADVIKVPKEKNHNFSKVCNFGFKYAIRKYNPDWIVLLNNDTILDHPDWLSHALKVADSNRKIGTIGVKLLNPDGSLQEAGASIEYSLDGRVRSWKSVNPSTVSRTKQNSVYTTTMIPSCVWLISRALMDRIGMFDELYIDFAGCADSDYFICAERAGFRAVFDGGTSAIHLGSFTKKQASSVERRKSYLKDLNANQMYMMYKLYTTTYRIVSVLRWTIGGLRGSDMRLWRLYASAYGLLEGRRLYRKFLSTEGEV